MLRHSYNIRSNTNVCTSSFSDLPLAVWVTKAMQFDVEPMDWADDALCGLGSWQLILRQYSASCHFLDLEHRVCFISLNEISVTSKDEESDQV